MCYAVQCLRCPQIFIYKKQNIHSTNAWDKESYLNRTRLSCTLALKEKRQSFEDARVDILEEWRLEKTVKEGIYIRCEWPLFNRGYDLHQIPFPSISTSTHPFLQEILIAHMIAGREISHLGPGGVWGLNTLDSGVVLKLNKPLGRETQHAHEPKGVQLPSFQGKHSRLPWPGWLTGYIDTK